MGAEGQPVHQGSHHGRVFKQIGPPGEGEVGGYDGAALLAAVGDHFEEQLGLVAVETQVAQLVQDEQVSLGQGPFQLACKILTPSFVSQNCSIYRIFM